MSSTFHNAVSTALLGVVRGPAGQTVVYRRGEDLEVQIDAAARGESTWEQDDEQGVLTELRSVDWLIAADDLSLPGDAGRTEPRRGDKIIVTIAGVEHVYEVLRPADGEPEWRWMDAAQTVRRIHTRLIELGGDS